MSKFTFRCEGHIIVSPDTHPASPVAHIGAGEPRREVLSGRAYTVEHHNLEGRKLITVCPDGHDYQEQILLYVGPKEPLSVVFVMNEAGRTIDTIR